MKSWNELSMAEKADVMKLAIEGGVYDLDSIRSGYNEFASGGSIHIKHPGRLTELKERTGKTEAELYNDGNPAHKKMVVFARNARKWKHGLGGNLFDGTSQPTQQMVIHKPYYDIDHALHYNIDFPEVTIIPDSKLSPAERNYRERQRQKNLPDYEEQKAKEYTGIQQLAAQKAWEESTEKKLLDYGQAATTGIGMGADIVSGLPIYSSLKGASVLSRAETPLDYAEGAMWVAPALGGAYQTTKPIVKQAIQTAIDNGGFAVSSPRIGKVFGKDVGQFTAWVPFDRSWSEGLSWINTGAPTSEGLPIQYITSKHSGEGRKLYDAVINKAREEGYPGIITGRELISAPKTYRTLEHYYPNRVKLDDMGHWSNDSMTGLFEGPRKTVYSLEDFLQSVQETPNERVHFLGAPRYRLETPSTAFIEGTPAAEWSVGRTAPQITAENAASITPEQWTAAQDAAIARGDMAEAQRLRDLHFKVSAPNTKTDVPLWTSSEDAFNSFDLSHFGETDSGFFGYGHYLTPLEKYAASYHPVNRRFYVNMENPYIGNNDQYFNRVQYVKDRLALRKENVMRNLRDGKLTRFSKKLGINENTSLEDAERLVDKYIADETVKWNNKYVKYADEFEGKDGVLSWRELQGVPNEREGIYREVVVPKGEQIKLANAVTYDNNGVRIPLGERDNFNINDIRYGLLPFGIGLTGYGLFNNQEALGGNIKKRKR